MSECKFASCWMLVQGSRLLCWLFLRLVAEVLIEEQGFWLLIGSIEVRAGLKRYLAQFGSR